MTEFTSPDDAFHRDRVRRLTKKQALYDLLSDHEWHANYRCAEVGGVSFQGSIYKLRNEGWRIESRHSRGGIWEYRLTGRAEPGDRSPSLSGPQSKVAHGLLDGVQKVFGKDGVARVVAALDPALASSVTSLDRDRSSSLWR